MKRRFTTLTWSVLVLAALLPIGLLSLYAYRVASRSIKDLVRERNQSASVFTADMVRRDFDQGLTLVKSLAALPELVQEVEQHDEQKVRLRLRLAVNSLPIVDRAFVTDPAGLLWSDHPAAPDTLGKNFSHRDWFHALQSSSNSAPIVSEVYLRAAEPKVPVVAFAAPIRNRAGQPIGAVVCQYRMERIVERLRQMPLGPGGQVFLIDPRGELAAHPLTTPLSPNSRRFADVNVIQHALAGTASAVEFLDPIRNEKVVATVTPLSVAGRSWAVVAAQPVVEAYAPIAQLGAQLSIASGILAVAAAGLVVVLGRGSERNRLLNTKLRGRNHALQQFESIIRFSNDAIVAMNLDGTVISWNPAAERTYGYTSEEMRGQSFSKLLPASGQNELTLLLNQLHEGKAIINYETRLMRKNNQPLEVALTLSPIKDERGQSTGASVIVRDVTEQKRAGETLERERFLVDTLMENIPDHIYFKDRNSRFIRINPAMAALFRLRQPEDAMGKIDHDFFTTEHAQRAFEDEQEIIRSGQPMVNREEMETWPDGSVTWVSTTKQCLRDKRGDIIGTFGISRDITDRKRAEEALDQKARELARSNADLEQFAYAASHDLQEPLRMIASYTQLLERRYKDKLDADAHEFIQFAVDGALRMQVLINDLLSYSRVGTRGKPFQITDCAEIMRRVRSNLTVAIEESRAKIDSGPLPRVVADPTQMTQLLQNLIANAIKFRGERTPEVQVSADLHTPEAPVEWVFCVRDNGIGIEPQYFDRIFAIFQRLHTREQYPGTGIGLAVCKKIVERHDGRIWVESELDKGTAFFFTIPHREIPASA